MDAGRVKLSQCKVRGSAGGAINARKRVNKILNKKTIFKYEKVMKFYIIT